MLLFLLCSAPLQRRVKAVVFYCQTSALWTVILLPAWGILVRPKLDFRLSGRQYNLTMAEPSEVDQESGNCTFIHKLHHRQLCSPAKELLPRLGAAWVPHSMEVKAQHCWELCLCFVFIPFPAHTAENQDKQSFTLESCRGKAYIWYLLEAPSIIRKKIWGF